jgi:hypothetical protein
MGVWRHRGYEKCTQTFKEKPREERLLERHRHRTTDIDRGLLYFTKLLIAGIISFPCLMKEMYKWSADCIILTEKWRIIMWKTVPSPCCPPQILQGLAWNQARDCTVRVRRQSTWVLARLQIMNGSTKVGSFRQTDKKTIRRAFFHQTNLACPNILTAVQQPASHRVV